MTQKIDYGGYDVGRAKVYNSKQCVVPALDISALKCSMCNLILRDPCQVISCGHRYCRSCIDQLTSGGEGPFSCVVDKETFKKNEVRSDRGCLRDIKSLEVDCPTEPPCDWKGKLTDIDVHRDERCPNRKTLCSQGCGGLYKVVDIEAHKESQCPKRPVSCEYCKRGIALDAIKEHYGVCEEHPVPCDYCQKELSARKHLSNHLEQDCEEYLMQCPKPGCNFKGRKTEMMQHALSKHLLQTMELAFGMEVRMVALESENKALRNELKESQSKLTKLQTKTDELAQENERKNVDIESLKSIIEQLQKERDEKDLAQSEGRNWGDTVDKDGPTKSKFMAVVQSSKYQLKGLATQPDLCDSTTPFRGKFRVSEDKAIRSLNGEPPLPPQYEPVYSLTGTVPDVTRPDVELNRVKQDVEVMQSKLQHLNEIVQSSQDNQTRYGVAIDEIRLRQDVLDVKTVNGILIWKIPDIRRRYRDAVDRRTISLYSPPFYTSPHGYRMCIRTYLNGDGIGKGTHLSLFFVVMRSEQDNLLAWPFKQSVRFTLINQKNPSASITEAFVPDLNSPSFQKPENDMNIASGFPKFCRQSVLQDEEFTLGNMIYIKCQVDLAGLSIQ